MRQQPQTQGVDTVGKIARGPRPFSGSAAALGFLRRVVDTLLTLHLKEEEISLRQGPCEVDQRDGAGFSGGDHGV